MQPTHLDLGAGDPLVDRMVRGIRAARGMSSLNTAITLCSRGAPAPRDGEHLDGYYDQSHFIREFRYFTGTTPMSLLARRVASSTAVTDHLLRGDLAAAMPH